MKLFAVECNTTNSLGILKLWPGIGGHSISYNENGCTVVCDDMNYFTKGHLSKSYTIICEFNPAKNIEFFKIALQKECPSNLKQLIALYGTKIA